LATKIPDASERETQLGLRPGPDFRRDGRGFRKRCPRGIGMPGEMLRFSPAAEQKPQAHAIGGGAQQRLAGIEAPARLVETGLMGMRQAEVTQELAFRARVADFAGNDQGGFESIARLVKPGGHIVIGLYNTYGRLAVDSRRVFFRLTGGRMKWVDPHLRGGHMSPEKIDAWFHDQYLHPHETKQTMGEVLGWFEKSGFEFVSSVPNTNPWVPFTQREELFTPTSSGSSLDRTIVQTKMIVTGNREGGFFIMIGKRSGHS